MSASYSTQEVANLAGVHRDTLLRWLRDSVVPEPGRDRHGWRVFSERQAQVIADFAKRGAPLPAAVPNDSAVNRLQQVDWDFSEATTTYLTHGIHPYPAKFIPQIPNALIQELSSVGDTIADIFCGSGTTLLEALLLKRHAIGIDANPLAALISRAKTTPLSDTGLQLAAEHLAKCDNLATRIGLAEGDMFYEGRAFVSDGARPDAGTTEFWFLPHVVEELAELRRAITSIPDTDARTLCEVCLSAIIVSVSNQDSDTRYVRRNKTIGPGDTMRRYVLQLGPALNAVRELGDLREQRFKCSIYEQSILDTPNTEPFDLVVSSPPYPNAYSYHLYHRTRLLWLGHDPANFKKVEIGSHRKYSSKGRNRATEETFRQEFEKIFQWIRGRLKDNKYACFVIGDSTLSGRKIDNASLIASAGTHAGFREVARLNRTIRATKKAFNPVIGKIRAENILVLQKV